MAFPPNILLTRAVKKSNNNPHSNAKRCIRILSVCQTAWHTRCDDAVSLHFNAFFACPVEPPRCGAAHSKYSRKREHQCGDVVYLKTETKPFTKNAYSLHSALHSRLTQESPKSCTINLSLKLKKKHVITRLETSLLANVHINSVNMNLAII